MTVRLSLSSTLVTAISGTMLMAATVNGKPTFSIAHRGASAYAPEHTMAAYRLALAQGADYVEQDLDITKDGVLVCSHDPSLERTTNVEEIFPDRFTEVKQGDRTVKRWYIEDFTLAEIKRLDAGSWFDPPAGASKFAGEKVVTFQEAIDLIKGKAGFFPELKTPARVRAKGFDVEQAVADMLTKNGLVGATFKGLPAVHMQVFEEDSLRRLARLLPDVPRSFLIGTPDMTAKWLSAEGLKEAKTFVTGVAPAKQILDRDPQIVARAHELGLTVVPYTFRQADEMRKFVEVYKVDGLFTDNPDLFPR
jgi:glycerophosphoryl diester phosphodiesterase